MEIQMYMNVETGSVDSCDGWNYDNEDGEQANAVELGEVVPVAWNNKTESWDE